MCVCVLIKLFGLSQMAWHDDQVGLVSNSVYVDICNLFIRVSVLSWCILYVMIEHVIALKTSFLQKCTYIMHCCILNQNMGCLRVHSKYSLACHWLFYWPGMKEQDMMKNTSVTNMRARTLPSQNACRVKADGMGPSYRRRFPLLKFIWYSALVALSM